MRLGTMTSLFRDRRECAEHFGYIESIQRCRKAGFTVLDMNLCALNRRQTTLHLDNWQEQVDEIRNEAERLGCVFSQSHHSPPPKRKHFSAPCRCAPLKSPRCWAPSGR